MWIRFAGFVMSGAAAGGAEILIALTVTIVTTTMTGARAATGMGMAITTGHMIGVGMVAGIVAGTTTIDVPISDYSQDSPILSLIPSTAVYPPFSMS